MGGQAGFPLRTPPGHIIRDPDIAGRSINNTAIDTGLAAYRCTICGANSICPCVEQVIDECGGIICLACFRQQPDAALGNGDASGSGKIGELGVLAAHARLHQARNPERQNLFPREQLSGACYGLISASQYPGSSGGTSSANRFRAACEPPGEAEKDSSRTACSFQCPLEPRAIRRIQECIGPLDPANKRRIACAQRIVDSVLLKPGINIGAVQLAECVVELVVFYGTDFGLSADACGPCVVILDKLVGCKAGTFGNGGDQRGYQVGARLLVFEAQPLVCSIWGL